MSDFLEIIRLAKKCLSEEAYIKVIKIIEHDRNCVVDIDLKGESGPKGECTDKFNTPKIKHGENGAKHYLCPKCEKRITSTMNLRQEGIKCNYCPDCGQMLNWDGIKLETYWPQ